MLSAYRRGNICYRLEFWAKRALWIRAKIPRNRETLMVIAREASAIHFDESQSFASSDSLKPIAITSPEVIQRFPHASVKISLYMNITNGLTVVIIIQQRILHWGC